VKPTASCNRTAHPRLTKPVRASPNFYTLAVPAQGWDVREQCYIHRVEAIRVPGKMTRIRSALRYAALSRRSLQSPNHFSLGEPRRMCVRLRRAGETKTAPLIE
jgi:hypothetical protein